MTDIIKCDMCHQNPSEHQNGLCDACYQAEQARMIADMIAQAEQIRQHTPMTPKKVKKTK